MRKNCLVCTLYEGEYHLGVAALINSLYRSGYKYDFYIGYKGQLPPWANETNDATDLEWPAARQIEIVKGSVIYFLPVETDLHLTNYKPSFLISLQGYTDFGLFYFDPDIVIKCEWIFFERWLQYGVAVVQEIVMNNCSPTHPRRAGMQSVIEKCGRNTERLLYHYFNGGFCGVKKDDVDFLIAWKEIIQTGIDYFHYDSHHFSKKLAQTNLFPAGDQDALNAAAMCCKPNISDFGPEGMDFVPSGWLLSHATGSPKPWQINYLRKAFSGRSINLAEKNYWQHVNTFIKTHKTFHLQRKKLSIKIASFVSRFYAKK